MMCFSLWQIVLTPHTNGILRCLYRLVAEKITFHFHVKCMDYQGLVNITFVK